MLACFVVECVGLRTHACHLPGWAPSLLQYCLRLISTTRNTTQVFPNTSINNGRRTAPHHHGRYMYSTRFGCFVTRRMSDSECRLNLPPPCCFDLLHAPIYTHITHSHEHTNTHTHTPDRTTCMCARARTHSPCHASQRTHTTHPPTKNFKT